MSYIPAKYLLLFFALLIFSSAFSQQPDTVVVYEYIYKTDTIWMEPKPVRDTIVLYQLKSIENATLILDTVQMKANLEIFSSGASATIPINCIILKGNQENLKSMKKTTFLGLTFLALNASLFAQPNIEKNIGVYLRGNFGGQTTHYYDFEKYEPYKQATTGANAEVSAVIGIKGNWPFSSYLSFSPRLSYTCIRGLKKHAYTKFPDSNKVYDIYNGIQASIFYFLSTDFLINYYLPIGKHTNYRIYGGLRTDFLVKQKEGIDLTDTNYTDFKKFMLNYVGGIGFDFGKHIYLEMEYSNHINNFVNTDYMWVKYGALSLNIGCYLF
jgi:hypothetical protein